MTVALFGHRLPPAPLRWQWRRWPRSLASWCVMVGGDPSRVERARPVPGTDEGVAHRAGVCRGFWLWLSRSCHARHWPSAMAEPSASLVLEGADGLEGGSLAAVGLSRRALQPVAGRPLSTPYAAFVVAGRGPVPPCPRRWHLVFVRLQLHKPARPCINVALLACATLVGARRARTRGTRGRVP